MLKYVKGTYINMLKCLCNINAYEVHNRLEDGRHEDRKAIKMFLLVIVVIV